MDVNGGRFSTSAHCLKGQDFSALRNGIDAAETDPGRRPANREVLLHCTHEFNFCSGRRLPGFGAGCQLANVAKPTSPKDRIQVRPWCRPKMTRFFAAAQQ
jgi:hypothetical protein